MNWGAGGAVKLGGGAEGNTAGDFSVFVGDLGGDVTDAVLLNTFLGRFPSTRSAKVIITAVLFFPRRASMVEAN